MENLNVLIVCTNAELLKVIVRLLNQPEKWVGIGANSTAVAIDIFDKEAIDVVLLGAGLTEEEELTLTQLFKIKQDNVLIIKHYGGGSGLLFNEIQGALEAINLALI